MPPTKNPSLSKTRFGAGLQCLKRLHLECYSRKLADPIDARQRALFDAGTAVGELARKRFPGGRLIKEKYYEHSRALASTSEAIAAQPVPAIYEAAFDSVAESNLGYKPKYIASTATIRNSADQCKRLYSRDCRIFPSPGLNNDDSYFSRLDSSTSRATKPRSDCRCAHCTAKSSTERHKTSFSVLFND